MKTTMSIFVALVLCANVHAADDEKYNLPVNRITGHVACSLTDLNTDQPSFDCTLKVKGNKNFMIEMVKSQPKKHGHDFKGFYGIDVSEADNVEKHFTVVADENKAVQGVSFADVVKSEEQEIHANIAGSAATVVKAASIAPLKVAFNKDKSNMEVNVWFTMYCQDAGLVAKVENGFIPAEVMNLIAPQIQRLMSK